MNYAHNLFNSLQQATKTSGLDMALWVDSVIRNVLIGSNLTASGSSIGSAAEGGGTFDKSDACGTAAASGGTCVYGTPATLTTQTRPEGGIQRPPAVRFAQVPEQTDLAAA